MTPLLSETDATTPPSPGLTNALAAARLAADGPNTVAAPPRRRLAARIAHQLTDPLVALLLAAAVVTAVLGDLPDTAIIALVITVNTAIGVAQEVRADRAIAALDRLAAPTARVVRDGTDLLIPAAGVVRDDVVRLEAGDIVPADLRLTVAHRRAAARPDPLDQPAHPWRTGSGPRCGTCRAGHHATATALPPGVRARWRSGPRRSRHRPAHRRGDPGRRGVRPACRPALAIGRLPGARSGPARRGPSPYAHPATVTIAGRTRAFSRPSRSPPCFRSPVSWCPRCAPCSAPTPSTPWR
jgi:hypothetical protein